jgi:hypothetical protein
MRRRNGVIAVSFNLRGHMPASIKVRLQRLPLLARLHRVSGLVQRVFMNLLLPDNTAPVQ